MCSLDSDMKQSIDVLVKISLMGIREESGITPGSGTQTQWLLPRSCCSCFAEGQREVMMPTQWLCPGLPEPPLWPETPNGMALSQGVRSLVRVTSRGW